MSESNFKIPKDKRQRSSSSLIANVLENTFSERKVNIRASIPEVEDQFSVAETRCDELKEKLDLVKALKTHKKRLKKRSLTRFTGTEDLTELQPSHIYQDDAAGQNEPMQRCSHDPSRFISVHARPKKKAVAPQSRVRRPPESYRIKNPSRSYVDPDTNEQHRMLDRLRDYDRSYTQECLHTLQGLPQQGSQQNIITKEATEAPRRRIRRVNRANRDGGFQPPAAAYTTGIHREKRDPAVFIQGDRRPKRRPAVAAAAAAAAAIERSLQREEEEPRQQQQAAREERPVVELFNKSRAAAAAAVQSSTPRAAPHAAPRAAPRTVFAQTPTSTVPNRKAHNPPKLSWAERRCVLARAELWAAAIEEMGQLMKGMKKILQERASKTSSFLDGEGVHITPSKTTSIIRRRGRYTSSRGYELPTVASRMKQRGARLSYTVGNVTSIPFIVSKSTAPSHNIGMNIQQVLNGLKMQQPISGIPLTIAHHMGLRHTPNWGSARPDNTATRESSLETHDINLIKMGRRLLRLPSYKYISYGRMLSLYREGDGMVPRFLRAMSRPNYYYQPMFSVSDRGDDAMPQRRNSRHQMKQSLAEYASLCREYEALTARKGADEATQRRLEELTAELNAREDHIRRVVTSYKPRGSGSTALRASGSTLISGAAAAAIDCVGSAYRLNAASEL